MKGAKKALRATIREEKAGERAVDEIDATEIIERLPEFAAAHTVALYHALPDEVPTKEMLRRWRRHKRLVLPVVSGDGQMFFREYTGDNELCAGTFGIQEPKCGAVIPPTEIDLILVPGVAFDNTGRRLGRGGGFYDRYLSQPSAMHIYKVGLCRPGALVPEVPAEAHDVGMDRVVTIG